MEGKINTCLTLIIVFLSLINGINAINPNQLQVLKDIFRDIQFKEEFFEERDKILTGNIEGSNLIKVSGDNVTALELGSKLDGGNIEKSICGLVGLKVLDLSENNLLGEKNNYGQLPKCLEDLELEEIRINHNNFRGKMPEFQSHSLKVCDIRGLQLCVYADLKIPKKCISDSYKGNEVPIGNDGSLLIADKDVLKICTSNFGKKSSKKNEINSTDWKIIISSSIFPLCSVVITSGVTLYGRIKSKFNKRNTVMMTTFTASISHLPNNFANLSNTNNRQSLLVTRYDSYSHPEPKPVNESQNSSEPKDNTSNASNSTNNSNKESQNPTKPNPIFSPSELKNPTKPSPAFSPSEFKNLNYRSIGNGNYTQNVRFKNANSPAQNRFSIGSGILYNNENIVIPVATPSVASSLPVIRETIDESIGESLNETINKSINENGNRNGNEIGIEIGNGNEIVNEIKNENGNENKNKNKNENENKNEIEIGNVNEHTIENRIVNENGNENHIINASERNDDVKSVVSDVRSNVSTPSKAKESLNMLINSPEMMYLRNVSPILQSKQGLMLDKSPLLPPKSFPSVSPKIKSPKDKSKSPLIMSPNNKDYINLSLSSQSRGTINLNNSQSSQSKGNINSSQSTQNRLSFNRPIRNRPRIRRVVYSFAAALPDEISLTPGQEVVIYNLFDDGYAYGKNITNGKKGVFPIDSLHPDDQEITQDDLETSSIISDLQISQLIKSPNVMSPLANVTGSSSQYMKSPMSPLANVTSSSSQYMKSPNAAMSPLAYSSSQYSNIKVPDMTTSFLINNASSSDGIGKLNFNNRYSFDIGQNSQNSYSQDSISQGSFSHNSNNSYIGEDDIDSLRIQSKVGYTAYIDQQKQKMKQKQKLKQKNKNNYEYYQEQPFSPTFSNNMLINNNVNNNRVVDGNVLQQSYQIRQNQNQFPVNNIKATSSTVSYPKSSKNRPTNNNDVDSPVETETEERRQRQIQLLIENLNRKDIGPEERRYYLQLLKQLKH